MSIYLDELFLINFIGCLFMLIIYGRLVSLPINGLRLAAASILGAAIACAGFLKSGLLIWMRAAQILIPLCAFKKISPQKLIMFVLIKHGAGGLAVLSVSLFGGSAAVIRDGILYFDISPQVFAAVFALTLALTFAAAYVKKLIRSRRFFTLRVYNGENRITLRAMYDSGNLLKDPYDGSDVVIVYRDAVTEIYDGRFRLIPFRALGTESGLIKAFKADKGEIVETGKIINNMTIGISENMLSKNGKIQALIGAGFMEE